MTTPHANEDTHLDHLIGEASSDDRAGFELHLAACPKCKVRFEEYREILRVGLPSIASGMTGDEYADSLPRPVQDGEKRHDTAIKDRAAVGADGRSALTALLSRRTQNLHKKFWSGALRRGMGVGLVVAASMLLALGLAESIYRLGVKHGTMQTRILQAQRTGDASLRIQFDLLVQERDSLRARVLARSHQIHELNDKFERHPKQSEPIGTSSQIAGQQAEERYRQVFLEREELARKLNEEQAMLAATQKQLDTLQQVGTNDVLRLASLETKNQQATQALKDKDVTIDEQQQMLASDRDIRDLITARDLYIAEVYDVGGNGKPKKPFGRVFYTKGKSLIFYGYDLDQEPGVKNASTFQAWGLRGPDRNTALNLGVMYADNSTNKRWVLRFDDPKALAQINAVFVTVELNGESRVPQGKQVLFAYLKEEPNHP
jgi:hypothetical protein